MIILSMLDPWSALRQQIIAEIQKTYKLDVASLLEEGRPGFGDFALPCFLLTKTFRAQPQAIAAEMATKLKLKYFTTKVTGSYLKFYINWDRFANELLTQINDKYGTLPITKKTAVVDFSSPNPAHPFHMGTTRSTILGEALCRILASQGWRVRRFCYINDLGKQAATLLLGYQTLASGKRPVGKPDVWLGQLYFKINQAIEEGTEHLSEHVEELLRHLERREPSAVADAKKIFNWCLAGFRQNWRLLRIKFDDIVCESAFVRDGAAIAEAAKLAGMTFAADGATVLNLEPHGLPNTIIVRSDGTGLYLTRDLACTLWKFEKYSPELNVWVAGEDHKLHFAQQLKVLDLLGHTEPATKSQHLAISMVLLEGRKMSGRKGWLVLWDELLTEGIEKAAEEVAKRWPGLSVRERQRRSQQIALAAIIYFILKYSPEKPVNFSWDTALRFEGETGPYLQYTHARAGSILAKAKVKSVRKFDGAVLKDSRERAVLKLLAQYPAVLAKAARDLRPHYLAGYLFNLSDAFNEFYQALPVIRADRQLRAARLKLVAATKTVLKSGLGMLGIAAPEKM